MVSFFDYRILRNDPYLILLFYFFSLLFLAGLFYFAPEIRGVKSWYKLGPFSFDPIELTKLVLIILLAKYFSMRHIEMYRIRHILLSGIYVALPSVLIFFQPDLGSVLILIALWVGVLLISGIKIRHFLILCLAGLLLFALSWSFLLRDYQKDRILSFVSPQMEPLGAGWSQIQAKIAVGAGGIFGQGLGQGSQTQYGFLSEPQTDFIFASIAEEFGMLGVLILFFLFLILIWRIIKIGIASQTNFPRLFASGLAIILVAQIFINIGMNLGFLPIIGISLPLVSYGGSGLIMTLIGLAILENIKVNS
ncbi:MAG TPA: FtsW/RodA/SpoVE family cell cycle protein [Candidatus Parcubacteria bacterium]|nr:FtsW/RodA/SpoVE family cell cycle protein [Candidatus Parcubacteria bacterium]